jgi:uncharacterized LabA/DUF88 family protein
MKTVVYIDGQNFLYKAADVLIANGKINDKQDLYNISVRSLLEGVLGHNDLVIKFYGAKLKKYSDTKELLQKSTTMIDSNRKLKNSLNKEKITCIDGGRLKLRDSDKCGACGHKDRRFQEKGVDVRMAVDIILDSQQDHVSKQVLVSSDTDLIPAIKVVTNNGKDLVYVGFSDKLTFSLSREATETQTIRDQEIIDAFDKFNPPALSISDKA